MIRDVIHFCLSCMLLSCAVETRSEGPAQKSEGKYVFVGESFSLRMAPTQSAEDAGFELNEEQIISPTLFATDEDGVRWLGWTEGGKKVWAPEPLIAFVAEENVHPGNLSIGEERVDRWRALPLDYRPDDMRPIKSRWNYYPDRECLMRAEAAGKAEALFSAAAEAGLQLRVVSSFRPASVQRDLYLNKIKSAGYAQQAVARPGNSEHQLGTAMDINGLDEDSLVVQSFGETAEGQWVKENCQRFGFVVSYTESNTALTGYEAEPWHLRYVGIEKAANWQALGPVK